MIPQLPPRVMHVVRRLGVGGLEVGVINLVNGLNRLGYSQSVCCLEDLGELASCLPGSVAVWECAPDPDDGRRFPWRAARHIRDWRPDVVHARNGSAWIDAAAAWLLAGRRGHLAFSIHGWDRLGRLPPRRAFLYRQLARVTRSLAAVSVETARQFAEETDIPIGRFVVLESGVDTGRFHPPGPPAASGRLVVGCVGRLDPVKAHDVLIEAFARVVDDGNREIELHLLGEGPCLPALERLVDERGLAAHVRFLGTAHDVAVRLREMDLFVLASHREGRPTSIMEAMASGLPVIASRVGSIPELVQHGRTGLLFDPGDAAGLATALSTLIADEPNRRRFAEEARRVAVAELSLDRMIAQYAEFYRRAAGIAGPGTPTPGVPDQSAEVAR